MNRSGLRYFENILDTVTSTFEGMSVTLSYLIRKPTTIQYPDKLDVRVQDTLPKRYRGHLEVDLDICTNCKACERDCPITCISIVDSDQSDKKRWIATFDIDLAKCMYCGICSEVCPTGALRHSQEFEGASYNLAMMARHFVLDTAVAPFKPNKGGETDPTLSKKVGIGKEYMDEFAQPN